MKPGLGPYFSMFAALFSEGDYCLVFVVFAVGGVGAGGGQAWNPGSANNSD